MSVPAFVLVGPEVPRELPYAWPRERALAFADTVIQSVDGTTNEVVGTGQRLYTPIEIDCKLEAPEGEQWERLQLAEALANLMLDLDQTTSVQFGRAAYPVSKIRLIARAPTERGWRLTLRVLGPKHEFEDEEGNPLPVA